MRYFLCFSGSGGDGMEGPMRWDNMLADNPHCVLNLDKLGYQIMSFGQHEMECEVKIVDTISKPGGKLSTAARCRVNNRDQKLQRLS